MWLELNCNVYVCVYVSEWFRTTESEWRLVRIDDDDRASIDPRSQWIIRFVPSSRCVNIIIRLSACNKGCRVYEIISIISVAIIARWCDSIVNNLPGQFAYARYTDTNLASRSSSFRRLIVGRVAYVQVETNVPFRTQYERNLTLRIRV